MMSFRVVVLVLSILLAGIAPGCKDRQPKVKTDTVVLRVNGEAITEAEVGMKIQQLMGHGREVSPEIRQSAEKELVEQELLAQKGRQLGLDQDEKYRQAVRAMEIRVRDFQRAELARRVRNTQVAAFVEVTDEDVKQYYAGNKTTLSTDVHLLVLRFADEASARRARNEMSEGKPFETVLVNTDAASEPTKPAVQDLGFLRWNQVPVEWAGAAASLNDGEVSDVLISGRTGPCIIKVLERRTNVDEPFETMSASIMNRLRDQRLLEAYDRYIAGLKKEAKIVRK
jgi:parvulin-like peptidyl-prolyl isomerase